MIIDISNSKFAHWLRLNILQSDNITICHLSYHYIFVNAILEMYIKLCTVTDLNRLCIIAMLGTRISLLPWQWNRSILHGSKESESKAKFDKVIKLNVSGCYGYQNNLFLIQSFSMRNVIATAYRKFNI